MLKHLRSGFAGIVLIVLMGLIVLGVAGYYLHKQQSPSSQIQNQNQGGNNVGQSQTPTPTSVQNSSSSANESNSDANIDAKMNDLNNASASVEQGLNDKPIDVNQ